MVGSNIAKRLIGCGTQKEVNLPIITSFRLEYILKKVFINWLRPFKFPWRKKERRKKLLFMLMLRGSEDATAQRRQRKASGVFLMKSALCSGAAHGATCVRPQPRRLWGHTNYHLQSVQTFSSRRVGRILLALSHYPLFLQCFFIQTFPHSFHFIPSPSIAPFKPMHR